MAMSIVALVVLASGLDSTADSSSWGDISGQFVLGGKLAGTKARKLLVAPESRGIANVVVRLHSERKANVHSDYRRTEYSDVVVRVNGQGYVPYISLVRTTQRLVLENNDSVAHAPSFMTVLNPPREFILPAGEFEPHFFEQPERLPVRLSCLRSPKANGYVVVSQHPYVAVTDRDGRFRIRRFPVGTWTFRAWHKDIRNFEVTWGGSRDNASDRWGRGQFVLEVHSGDNDLGKIVVNPRSLDR